MPSLLLATIVQTNFISGLVYSNDTTKTLDFGMSVTLTPASVVGAANLTLVVTNATTGFNAVIPTSLTTLIGSLVMPSTVRVGGVFIPANSTYWLTNVSTGAGNSATPVAGSGLLRTSSNQ